jgi:hypothetical protein
MSDWIRSSVHGAAREKKNPKLGHKVVVLDPFRIVTDDLSDSLDPFDLLTLPSSDFDREELTERQINHVARRLKQHFGS